MCRIPFHELHFNRFLELLEHKSGNGNIFMVVFDSVCKDQLKGTKTVLKIQLEILLDLLNAHYDFKKFSISTVTITGDLTQN